MRFLLLLLTLSMFYSGAAHAQIRAKYALDMSAFKNIPIMHEGRLKPLDSFAKITLKQLSGQTALDELSAINWLALSLFDPQTAAQIPVFQTPNSELQEKLGLTSNKKLLNLEELKPALDQTRSDIETLINKDENSLNANERALLRLHENAAILTMLMRSFSAFLPLDIKLPPHYRKQLEGELTFTELAKIEQQLKEDLERIITTKGRDPSSYNAEELSIAKASFHTQMLRTGGVNNRLLRIIPSTWENAKEPWLSPWEVLLSGEGSPASAFLLSQWSDLSKVYRAGNRDSWHLTSTDILNEARIQSKNQPDISRFTLERIYTNWKLYLWILGFYGLSLFTAALIIFKPEFLPRKTPFILASAGIALHIAALGARIYILQRPPVGTLYESVLFVTLICALAAMITALRRKNLITLIAGLTASIGLLLTAPVFAPETDSLEVLVAVLNTDFWLTTHVLCITAGYGICILSACLAHTALYIRGFKNNGALWLKLQQNTYHLSLAGLLFTGVGTILGGIWADQSWGRFWGWDPKENGALLIVLWLIWAQHGRAAAKVRPVTFMALIAALNIVVAISWFGVNLLNIGLHSYGFTSGMAESLLAFCLLELALIASLYVTANKKEINHV